MTGKDKNSTVSNLDSIREKLQQLRLTEKDIFIPSLNEKMIIKELTGFQLFDIVEICSDNGKLNNKKWTLAHLVENGGLRSHPQVPSPAPGHL